MLDSGGNLFSINFDKVKVEISVNFKLYINNRKKKIRVLKYKSVSLISVISIDHNRVMIKYK